MLVRQPRGARSTRAEEPAIRADDVACLAHNLASSNPGNAFTVRSRSGEGSTR
jgi:hypothetical protein